MLPALLFNQTAVADELLRCSYTLLSATLQMPYTRAIIALLQGAESVSAYVTHGVFPNHSWKRFTADSSNGDPKPAFKYFWITDSCPSTVAAVQNQSPFDVISLAEPIAAALQI